MGFQTRTPTSNDLPRPKIDGPNPWIEENDLADAVGLILIGRAKRCKICKRPIRLKYLDENQHCPDCRKI